MRYLVLTLCVLVAGCDTVRSATDRVFGGSREVPAPEPEVVEAVAEAPQPEAAPTNPRWAGPRTTIAGLGDPNTPGRWLRTPLVETEFTGRVVVPRTGAQAYITLVPAGPQDGGSRLSVDAMRALLVPFDELVELEVYAN